MDTRRLWLMILGSAWALAWAGSFVVAWLTEPEGEGFARGLNRVTAFLGWQGIAALLAVAIWGVGRSWPPGSSVRRLSRAPFSLAALLAAALAAVIAAARYRG